LSAMIIPYALDFALVAILLTLSAFMQQNW
jgi:hypothetical protein